MGSVASEVRRVVGVSTHLCRDRRCSSTSSWVTPAKNSFVSGGKWSNRYLYVLTVVTDNNRVQRFHRYIDDTRAQAVARSAMAIGAKAAISRRGKGVKRIFDTYLSVKLKYAYLKEYLTHTWCI